jgi:cysteine desulfurase
MEQPIYLNSSVRQPSSSQVVAAQMAALQGQTPPGRRQIWEALGLNGDHKLVVTSSGAEAVTHVITSAYLDDRGGKEHLLLGAGDETAAIEASVRCEAYGARVSLVPLNSQGAIDADNVREAMTSTTRLLSLSWANGLTGVINSVGEISDICHERGVLFHLDITHAIGKLVIDFDDLGADFITFDGPAFGAPDGTGGLVVRQGQFLSPMIGGDFEQKGLRAGAVSEVLCAGLGQAFKEAVASVDQCCTEVAQLRDRLEVQLMERVGAIPLLTESLRLPNVTCLAFDRVHGEALSFALQRQKVFTSIGGGAFQLLRVLLQNCQIEPALAASALSFSLNVHTQESQIDQVAGRILESVESLRKLSEAL